MNTILFRQFMFPTLKRYKRLYAALFALNLAVVGVSILLAEVNRRIFDGAGHTTLSKLYSLLAFLAVFTAARLLLNFAQQYFYTKLNENVVYQMRCDTLDHLQNLPLSFHEKNHSSGAMNIMYHDLDLTKEFIVSDVQKLFQLPVSLICAGAYLFWIHPMLGGIALAVGPLQLLSNLVLKARFERLMERQNEIGRQFFFLLNETLNGIREVKCNQMESKIQSEVEDLKEDSVSILLATSRIQSVRNILREVPYSVGTLVGIAACSVLMVQGRMGPGVLVAFMTLLDRVSTPFTSLSDVLTSLQRSLSGGYRLAEIMALAKEDTSSGETLPLKPATIQFRDVAFSYEEGHRVLDRIDFVIPAGSSVALVGPSGAGKTTLLKLLYRFYQPSSGSIEVNGQPIEAYSIHSLRAAISYVSQDIFLFDQTIAENIAIGNPDADPSEIENAARLSCCTEFISSLPQGFNTPIGERGICLSQGQKQRLALARTILRQSPILILDEPTSALDVETEQAIQETLSTWGNHCTKIIIAHRLSTIREADLVLFLENGRIVESGSPAGLFRTGGRFASYCHQQGLEFSSEKL